MSEKENIREIILIGRDHDCNFICNDSSVSRHHAQIIDYGTSCSVIDLDSTNGTFVNGRKVSSETTLHTGDLLRVGNVDIPWQQLVQPPQKPESNKKLLWILIPIIAALLVGGGLAIYFIYGNSKNKDKEAKEAERELVGELAQQITVNAEQKDSIQTIIETKRREIDSLDEARTQALNRAQKAAESEQEAKQREQEAKQEANRKVSEANIRMGEADDKLKEANEKLNEANEKLNEAEEKQTEAAQKATAAEEKMEQANQTLELAESIKQEPIMAAIESLNDEDIKAICRSLKIEFNVRLSAKDALKKEFLTSGDNRKQEIAIAIRQKQKSSNNDKK